jgi:thiosulfate/3-mercaptopyruvate sulfurtransferase
MNAVAGLLTDPAALARELAGETPPQVSDARWRLGGPPGAGSYRAGHLPGAVFVDLDADLSWPPGAGGRHPLPDRAAFQAAMRRAGVRADRPVVVCDDGDFTATAGGMEVGDPDGAAALARSGVLLDVRSAERYRGESEPVDPVAGHIPGALYVGSWSG